MNTSQDNNAEAMAAFQAALALHQEGRFVEAEALYDRAAALNPDFAEAHANRGAVLQALKRLPEARAAYDAALKLSPDHGGFLSNRGALRIDMGDAAGARADLNRAIALQPDNARAHNNLGIILLDSGQHAAALAAFERAIDLQPDLADAYASRGLALRNLKRFAEAVASFDRALALRPDQKFLAGQRVLAKLEICDWRDLVAETAALVAAVERGEQATPAFPLLALIDRADVHRRAAEIWTQSETPSDLTLGPIPRHPGHKKIRVGYFSMDFREHPVAALTVEMFERHDREKFEITAFSYGPEANDGMRRRLKGAFDHFLDVSAKSDLEIASLARALDIDIAVDLAGHTAGARSGIFALRAATVQINFLGYPGTMAAPYIDYIIADDVLIPRDHQAFYAEKVISLPCFQPNDTTRGVADVTPTRETLGLPREGFVFCSFNRAYKISPATFDGWMRILMQVPNAVLWLSSADDTTQANLRNAAVVHGVVPERLVFAGYVESATAHLARQRAADLFLDTLPYNAHTTASDALWAGLPVLTCVGEAYAGRVAASLLTAIGLPELITTTQRDYEAAAIGLATQPERLAAIRDKLARNRLTSRLFDIANFTRSLEAAYVKII